MRLLADRRFRWLLLAQTVSSIAVSALWLALGIWAKTLTNSNALAGSVFLALGLPSLLSPFGGHLIDRVRRRPLMIGTNVVIGAIVLVLLAVQGRGQLWLIYVVAALAGLTLDVLSSSTTALVKDMLTDERLGEANALLQTLSQGTRLLSPLLGAGLYAWLGGHRFAIADAALFAVAALAYCMIRVTESQPEPTAARFVTELLAGFRYVRTVPLLVQLMVVAALAFSVVGLFETTAFAVVGQGLHRPPSFLGVIESVQGAGAIIGGVVAATPVLRRFGEARTVGLGLASVAFASVGLTLPYVATVLCSIAMLGAGVSLFVVGFGTGLQRCTPPRLQGRVAATANMVLSGPQTASIALGAGLIAVVDYRVLLLATFTGMAIAGVILLVRPAHAPTNVPVTAPAAELVG